MDGRTVVTRNVPRYAPTGVAVLNPFHVTVVVSCSGTASGDPLLPRFTRCSGASVPRLFPPVVHDVDVDFGRYTTRLSQSHACPSSTQNSVSSRACRP